MPFVHASAAMGRVLAEHHHKSKIEEIRAQIAADDAKAARPHIQAMREALAPRITPENIDRHIATARQDLEQAKAAAANTRNAPSTRLNARQHIADSTRKLNRLHELKATLDQPGGGHETPGEHPVVTHNPAAKTKRGDVVAFVHQSSSSFVNGPTQTSTRVTIGEVTGATREGHVKEFRDFEGGAPRKLEHMGLQHAQRYILPAERLADKAGLEEHVRSRGFLAGSGNYKPFQSIEEAHAAIKPFVRRPGEAGKAEAAKRFQRR
jgi:hypothetical protein